MSEFGNSLRKRCSWKASLAAEGNGFVPMRNLAQQLGARIEARPLLVEACVATDGNAKNGCSPWVVLVDSERFKISNSQIDEESSQRPLRSRLRTTIAHELLHVLTLTSGGDNPKSHQVRRKGETTKEYITRIESLTERLTPLLLIPESEVDGLSSKLDISFADFLSTRKKCAVSREMLISRFSLLSHQDQRRFSGGLQNIALGMAQRSGVNTWELKPRPLFHNFHLNRLPWFLAKLDKGVAVQTSRLTNDATFLLNGGGDAEIDLPGNAPGQKLDYMKMRVRLTVEPIQRGREHPFLFFVQKLP